MSQHYALMSVSDKTDLGKLGRKFNDLGIEILSTGGTFKKLVAEEILVTKVSDFTGAQEIMGGRVKTLHPKIAAGILHRRDVSKDTEEMVKAGYGEGNIDYVIVNLYPFQETIAKPDVTEVEAIENIDIGGPTMVREAAKNFQWVCVIVDPADYNLLIAELEANNGTTTLEFRKQMAAKAFAHTCEYDLAIGRYISGGNFDGITGRLDRKHRYGENPQIKKSALYACDTADPLALHRFTQVEGVLPGYVNDTDLDRLLQTLTHIAETFKQNNRKFKYFAVGDKHGNACGASYGNDKLTVLRNMIRGNPRAIWGGMIITNFTIGAAEARILRKYMTKKRKRILDGVFAPEITAEAIKILKRPKGACKMLVNPALATPELDTSRWIRPVRGGFLMQSNHTYIFRFDRKSVERFGSLNRRQKDNLLLAVGICQTSNSNTTSIVAKRMLIGNGMARPDRCDTTILAVTNARQQKHKTKGAVAVTDSFFPFPDAPQVLIDAEVSAILTVSGSQGDEIVKKTILDSGVTLVWLPVGEGRMFFGH